MAECQKLGPRDLGDKATQKSVTLLVSSPLMEMADYFLGGVGIGVGGALP